MLFKAQLQALTLSIGGALIAAMVVATPIVVLAQSKQEQPIAEASPTTKPATTNASDIRGEWSKLTHS